MKKEILQYRLDNQLCTRCGDPAVSGRKMCDKHLTESRLKERKKRERRKSQNLCTRCGQRSSRPGKTQCNVCVDSYKDQYNAAKMDVYYQRRAAGVCVRCGKSVNDFVVHCDICTVYMRNKDKLYYDKTKNTGLCVHCRKSLPIKNEILCAICKKKNAIRGLECRNKQKFAAIQHYGGKCCICGETDGIVLCIDHIDGGGSQHRKQLQSQGITFYRWLKKNNYPSGFQTLCYNCNMKKYLSGEACLYKD